MNSRWQKHLDIFYPERIPATLTTFSRLPEEMQRFYRGRRISELAARCLISDHQKLRFLQSRGYRTRANSA